MAKCNPKCVSAPSIAEGPRLKVSLIDGKFPAGVPHVQCPECLAEEIARSLAETDKPVPNISKADIVKLVSDKVTEEVEVFKGENRDLIEQAKELSKPGGYWHGGK